MKQILSQVIIIGAGAAGLMCAITAAQRGRKVIVKLTKLAKEYFMKK